jgi:hypothetical protein
LRSPSAYIEEIYNLWGLSIEHEAAGFRRDLMTLFLSKPQEMIG